jgi:tetratricopeptide (TPR) repeat protein
MAALAIQLLLVVLVPTLDRFDKYPDAAALAAAGRLTPERRLDFSPFYLALVAGARRVAGDPTPPLLALQLALAALAAGAVTARAARHLPHPWALAAGALVALDLGLAVHARVLEPEVVQIACVAGCLALLPTGRRRDALLAGALAALSLATRATLAPLFLAGVPLALRLALGPGRAFRRVAVAFLLPVVATLAALQLRSLALVGPPLAAPMNPGTVFFEGNQPLSHGASAVYPPLVLALTADRLDEPDPAHQVYRDIARADAGRPLPAAEVNRVWGARARAALAEAPGRALRRLAEKLRLTFQAAAPHDVGAAADLARRLPLPAWLWPLAGAAALAGVAGLALERRRLAPWTLELLLAGNQLAVILVFYASARQRLLLLLAFAPLAAAAGARLHAAWRDGRRRPAALGILGVLLLALALSPAGERARDASRLQAGATAANRIFRTLERVEAGGASAASDQARLEGVIAAITEAPWLFDRIRPAGLPLDEAALLARVADRLAPRAARSPAAAFDLATLELRLGRRAEGRTRLAALVRENARFDRGGLGPSDPRTLLARFAARDGDRATARRLLDEALAAQPGDPFALAERVALAGDDGDAGSDTADLARLERTFGRLESRWLAGRALLAQGHADAAVAALAAVTAALPDAREPWIDLAAALGAAGQLEAGADAYLRAMQLALQPLQREREIVPLFLSLAERRPDDFAAQVYALQVLHQHGRRDEARAWLAARPALGGVPGVEAIARELATGGAAAVR